jgi:hypothetical protein
MPHYRCCVGLCDNDSRYPEKIIKLGHVQGELRWHYIPKVLKKRADWVDQISKGLQDFVATNYKVVCSNHFEYGKPTFASPIPTKFMGTRDKGKPSPNKRRTIYKRDAMPGPSKVKCPNVKEEVVNVQLSALWHTRVNRGEWLWNPANIKEGSLCYGFDLIT